MNQREQLFCRFACQDTVCHHGLFSFEDHSRHHCSVGSRVAPSLTCTSDMTTAWLLCDTIIANIINTMACRQLLQHRQTPASVSAGLSIVASLGQLTGIMMTHTVTHTVYIQIFEGCKF